MRALIVAVVALALSSAVEAECPSRAAARSSLDRLQTVMSTGRFVAYHPTSLVLVGSEWSEADPASIRDDLRLLRSRFDGVVTYASSHGADRIPDVAATLGYRAVIVGVWNPSDDAEVERALAAARRNQSVVVGVSLGNERVFAHEATFDDVAVAIRRARAQLPSLAYATTEPFHLLLEPPSDAVLAESDFMLANVHPAFQPWFRDAPAAAGAQFVVNVVDLLAPRCATVLVKETGLPTAPADLGFTAARQADFFAALQDRFRPARSRAFAYFAAFDAPWRIDDANPVPGQHPEETHWGLYDAERRAKPVVDSIAPLAR